MDRLKRLTGHLDGVRRDGDAEQHVAVAECSSSSSSSSSAEAGKGNKESAAVMMRSFIKMIENRLETEDQKRLMRELPGPMQEYGLEKAMFVIGKALSAGKNHEFFLDVAKKSGSPSANIVLPMVISPQGEVPYLESLVVIGHPDDARRMAKMHVLKSAMYGSAFLGQGVLSTRDNDSWRNQREHLAEGFLPIASLAKIFPISRERAEHAAVDILGKLSKDSKGNLVPVEINEFLLYETMAQLQLTLLGETKEYMEETNVPLRASFSRAALSREDPMETERIRRIARKEIHSYSNGIVARSFDGSGCPVHSGASEALKDPSKTVHGPVMARIADSCPMKSTIPRDNASTLLFAGHDTTAHMLTHFVYFMALHPEWQTKVQAEADDMIAKGDKLRLQDLDNYPVMKRCLNETLRIAPSVPNGTFREVQFDDSIMGPDGKQVLLKKGQQFVVPTWNLHHNAELWGDDVEEFNPDRAWLPEEDWHGANFRAYNNESYRYCPFTYGPRSCIGRPFAMMEARLIIASLFSKYTFEVAEPTKSKKDLSEISTNIFTFGPKNGLYVLCHPR